MGVKTAGSTSLARKKGVSTGYCALTPQDGNLDLRTVLVLLSMAWLIGSKTLGGEIPKFRERVSPDVAEWLKNNVSLPPLLRYQKGGSYYSSSRGSHLT